MKKFIKNCFVFILIFAVIGCAQPKDYELKLLSPKSISQDIYDDVQKSWDKWNAMSEESQFLSSSTPGYSGKVFDDWKECEEFLGFTVSNVMETCSWVERGMPAGYMDSSHIFVSYYGTEEGEIEWIDVTADYHHEKVKIGITALLYGTEVESNDSERTSSVELERQEYLEKADESIIQVTSNITDRVYGKLAYGAQEGVLYRINIVGELKLQEQVEETFLKVMEYFFEDKWAQYSEGTIAESN